MKKMYRKVISLILAVLMVLGSMAAGIGSIDFSAFTVKASALNYKDEYTVGDLTYKFEDTLDRVYVSGSVDSISGEVVIPKTVEIDGTDYPVIALGGHAFEGRTAITKVELTQNITEIREYAFKGCTGLTMLQLAEYDHLKSIGIYAFYGCTNLTLVASESSTESTDESGATTTSTEYTMSLASVASIGDYAFYGCSSLYILNFPSLVSLGAYAFCKSGIIQLMLPSGVTEIKEYTFADCTRLREAEYEGEITSIGEHAFDGCYNLGEFLYCSGVVHSVERLESFSSIADYVYETNSEIEIPSACTTVGDFAFFNCDVISYVSIPADAKLGMGALSAMNNLREFVVAGSNYTTDGKALYTADGKTLVQFALAQPDTTYTVVSGTTEIGAYAFYGSSNLRTVNLPDSVTTIDESAFNSCLALTKVCADSTSSLKTIKMLAFANCPKLKALYVPFNIYNGTVDETIYKNSYTDGTITIYAMTGMSDTELAAASMLTLASQFEGLFPAERNIYYVTTNKVEITFDLNGGVVDSEEGDITEIHTKGDTITAPAVTRDGYVLYSWSPEITAAEKDTVYHAVWAPENHSGHTLKAVVTPDEANGHYVNLYCEDCNIIVSRNIEWEHNYVVEGETKEATCTAAGYTNYKCTECGYTDKGKEVEALGHDYTVLVPGTEKAATCTTVATAEYKCSRCNATTIKTTGPALEHDWNVISEATCTTEGLKKCNRCGEKVTIAALGHVDADNNNICDRCGMVLYDNFRISIGTPTTNVIPYGHTLVLSAKTNAPVYDADGNVLEYEIPENCSVKWTFYDGNKDRHDDCLEVTQSDDGMTGYFKAYAKTRTVVLVQLIDNSTGEVCQRSDGTPIEDSITISTNCGIFQHIIYFFKTIFFISTKIY